MIVKFTDIRASSDLSSTAKLVAETLERETPRKYGQCLLSSESIGALIGRSARTVQLALAELKRVGAVAVKVCRWWLGRLVNSGHVISLLWRPKPLFSGATDCAEPAQEIAPESSPPRPPIEEPEGASKREADSEPEPLPLPDPSERRKATPAEVESAISRAVPVLRLHESAARSKIRALAKSWGLSWVVAALERTEAKAAVEPLRNPSGYLVRTLEGFRVEGGPPAPPPAPMTDEEFIARLDAVEAEREAFIASLGH